jgi:hypothetical protein
LQRIVNGGGRVDREYGLGRRRTDLLARPGNFPGGVQRAVIEIKRALRRALTDSGGRAGADMGVCGPAVGAEEAHLVNLRPPPWEGVA